MRKRLLAPIPPSVPPADWDCLDVSKVALAEVTSEDERHPIEFALVWDEKRLLARRAGPDLKQLRLLFDKPQTSKHIRLTFEETETKRTQEFTLRWGQVSQSYREIVRQQWSFSPPGTVREIEDYDVTLPDVTALELNIVPDQNGGEARASLVSLRLG